VAEGGYSGQWYVEVVVHWVPETIGRNGEEGW